MHSPSSSSSRTEALLDQAIHWFRNGQTQFRLVGRPFSGELPAGADIDIVVPGSRLAAVGQSFLSFCIDQGLPLLRRLRHAQGFRFDLAWHEPPDAIMTLPIDITGDLCAGARVLIQADSLLERADLQPSADVSRLPPALEFKYYLAKKIRKSRLETTEARHLREQWQADPAGCRDELDTMLPPEAAARIARAAETDDWAEARQAMTSMNTHLRKTASVSAAAMGRVALTALARLRSPAGLVIGAPQAQAAVLRQQLGGLFPTTISLDTSLDEISGSSRPATGRHGGFHALSRALSARYRNALLVLISDGPDLSRWHWPRPDLCLTDAGIPSRDLLDALRTRYRAPGHVD